MKMEFKKENIYARLCEIRDRFMNESGTNEPLTIGITQVYIEGYLTGLLNAGFLTNKEYNEILKKWVQK
jgi:hypothetical protein